MAEFDVVPDMLDEIKEIINTESKTSEIFKTLKNRVVEEKATTADADIYAQELGRIIQKAFAEVVTKDRLPDGIFYYNIVQRLFENIVQPAADQVETLSKAIINRQNKKAGFNVTIE